ncbi:hypothetical protein [Fictibacillus phosphorivorans]|uniref:hypothetical protein n=1 Tax=Fictibacillus phosphorivorans TaxID=1221500 RepID=UPI0012932873|nr:hypothetical protein [Fictibacillus phosphorivorans]MQR97138.1 hypothetical protein [Fictibacillus phosphorivorans]
MRKLKPFVIPLLFFLVVFIALTFENLKTELKLPNEDWSRSLPLQTEEIGEVKPVFQEQNGMKRVYVPKENEVLSFHVTDTLEVKDKQTTPLSIPSPQDFWVQGNQYVFVRDQQLIHYDGEKENVLDQDVRGMDSNPKKIIYFKENEILSVDRSSWSVRSLKKMPEQIYSIVLNDTSDSFLSVVKSAKQTSKQLKVTYHQLESQKVLREHVILDKDEQINENHFGFYFIENGNDVTVYYSLFSNNSGGKSYKIFQGTNQVNTNSDWNFSMMTFIDNNGIKLENPKFMQYGMDDNGKAKVLFTTRALKSNDKEAVNVYEARADGDVWKTELRSTTNYQSLHPYWIGEDSVIWLNLVGYKEYTFSGASKNPNVIEKSLKITRVDLKEAVSATVLSLFQGLIFAMSSVYWIAPSVLFALVIYIVKIKLMEDEDKRILYTILALFLGVQFIFIQKLFNTHYYMYAPDFLAFTGSSFVIPVALALISGAAVWYGRKQNWSKLTSICYFAAINTFFLSIVVGPYMF